MPGEEGKKIESKKKKKKCLWLITDYKFWLLSDPDLHVLFLLDMIPLRQRDLM